MQTCYIFKLPLNFSIYIHSDYSFLISLCNQRQSPKIKSVKLFWTPNSSYGWLSTRYAEFWKHDLNFNFHLWSWNSLPGLLSLLFLHRIRNTIYFSCHWFSKWYSINITREPIRNANSRVIPDLQNLTQQVPRSFWWVLRFENHCSMFLKK